MPNRRPSSSFYRVFQRRHGPGMCCAVRQGMLIPDFLRPGEWDFGATVHENGSLPFGFQPAPAREATAAFGYYLFHHPCETLSPTCSRRWT
ncbi:hypothetical protein [Methylobacterium sp. NEAU K]|uniref:hypothetical protein n=1 Tax=Methylobacterium sp. NEAU K TaxID=3064946 RepID=UPI002733F7F7|nr:hypothetical protein [Methylobacterium sp. NEAU K]MDP4003326.1 hypothetical protein [Methylobacterium sp. NEAU K]